MKNLTGRPPSMGTIRATAARSAGAALRVLDSIAADESAPTDVRVTAAKAVLEVARQPNAAGTSKDSAP